MIKGILKKLAKFTGKHLCLVSILIKMQAEACNFIKKETLAKVFSCKFCKILKNTFFIEHLRWLYIVLEIVWIFTSIFPCMYQILENRGCNLFILTFNLCGRIN